MKIIFDWSSCFRGDLCNYGRRTNDGRTPDYGHPINAPSGDLIVSGAYPEAPHYENLPMQYTENFLALKIEIFYLKNFDIFLTFAQNIDCGYKLEPRQGDSNEYPQSMFWSKNKKNWYTPAYPSFTYIKVGFTGVFIARTCFPDVITLPTLPALCKSLIGLCLYGFDEFGHIV